MFHLERQEEILDILQKNKSISVTKLAEMLFVSQPTIRRDLSELERQGKVRRTHGGVMLRNVSECEIPLLVREDQNNESKALIAERAARYIEDGSVIFMDASSTVSYLIPHLSRFQDLVVITNSPKVSMRLAERGIRNYCTGGMMLLHSIAFVGSEAEAFIANFNADILFFSSRGFMENGMITDSSVEEARIRKMMIKHSKKQIYLCDSNKRNKQYLYNICPVNEVEAVIDEL